MLKIDSTSIFLFSNTFISFAGRVLSASVIMLLSLNFVASEAREGTVSGALQAFSKALIWFVRACFEYL